MISIIVPTLNEADRLPRLLSGLRGQGVACEIIVVDGGSRDATPAVAVAHGARLLHAAAGRGRQLAAGARAARGRVILFLHADCVFPEGGLAAVEACLENSPEVVGGNFRLLFDGGTDFDRWLTGAYAWARRRGFYYGDSAIFVRAQTCRALGGIRPIALMEDYDFTRRLERAGKTVCIEDPPLVTSSRRFAGRHPVAIVWGWLKIHALYHLGVPPERLARLYDSERRRERPMPPTPQAQRF
ncbi:MAG: TIGR04283 family arsenosugar biosynthesis glycosyltransferase [Kiloniellaceae bacterium]